MQFFVFISQDGKYILKCVKHNHSSPRFLFNPEKREKRSKHIFNSCEIAYQYLKEETGLIALHLSPDSSKKQPCLLIDNLGIAHSIDLNTTSYLLQKRADSLINKKLTKSDIDSLIALMKNRIGLNICNEDPRPRNFGVIDSKVVEIDLGSFKKRENQGNLEALLNKETNPLKEWLQSQDQELYVYFTSKI